MSRALPLEFVSAIRDPAVASRTFEIRTATGQVTVRGFLSTGSRGWRLRAEAAKRRSVITIFVTAIETASRREPDLEHHEYTATVMLSRPGSFSVRITHAFFLRGEGGAGMPRPVFEDSAEVP